MQKLDWVLLIWEDACSDVSWYDPEDETQHPVLVITVGLIVHETKGFITISSTLNQTGRVADPLTVPKSCIVYRKRVKIALPNLSKWLYPQSLEGLNMKKATKKPQMPKKSAPKKASKSKPMKMAGSCKKGK